MNSIYRPVLAFAALLLGNMSLQAQESQRNDWSQILGPGRNGVAVGAAEPGWKGKPKVVWQVDIGEGFSAPVISGDSLILFHRPKGARKPYLVVEKFRVSNGESIWSRKIITEFSGGMDSDSGPKATPVVDSGFVYCYGPNGELVCVDFSNGEVVWNVNVRKEFGAQTGYFGCGSSPVVVDGKLLLNVGGKRKGASVVAFDVKSGEMVWKAIEDEASYSSPIVVEHEGSKIAVFLTRTRFVGLDVATGEVKFSNEFGKRGPTAVASMPVAFGSKLFANAAYNVGAAVVDLTNLGESGSSIGPDWTSKTAFASHYSTPVFFKGHLYGTSGREDMRNGSYRCIDAATGEVKWEKPFPVAHTLLIGGKLLVLDHKGKLSIIDPSPDKMLVASSAIAHDGPTRAIPAWSNGKLFFRTNAKSRVGKLICLDVTP